MRTATFSTTYLRLSVSRVTFMTASSPAELLSLTATMSHLRKP